jgi:hypothetical protein
VGRRKSPPPPRHISCGEGGQLCHSQVISPCLSATNTASSSALQREANIIQPPSTRAEPSGVSGLRARRCRGGAALPTTLVRAPCACACACATCVHACGRPRAHVVVAAALQMDARPPLCRRGATSPGLLLRPLLRPVDHDDGPPSITASSRGGWAGRKVAQIEVGAAELSLECGRAPELVAQALQRPLALLHLYRHTHTQRERERERERESQSAST